MVARRWLGEGADKSGNPTRPRPKGRVEVIVLTPVKLAQVFAFLFLTAFALVTVHRAGVHDMGDESGRAP